MHICLWRSLILLTASSVSSASMLWSALWTRARIFPQLFMLLLVPFSLENRDVRRESLLFASSFDWLWQTRRLLAWSLSCWVKHPEARYIHRLMRCLITMATPRPAFPLDFALEAFREQENLRQYLVEIGFSGAPTKERSWMLWSGWSICWMMNTLMTSAWQHTSSNDIYFEVHKAA
ncbi:uncharacterized protein LOC110989425 [Acanthaster planci]|uniref:Uncharacterized protein LOC110989425 n=1 Tax=Acanthaster planci TaxID=133434 RepID=A0A8B8A0X9_ACAPL|nr:uncharacterized protein LOC110989425 [Acanthaster planci]